MPNPKPTLFNEQQVIQYMYEFGRFFRNRVFFDKDEITYYNNIEIDMMAYRYFLALKRELLEDEVLERKITKYGGVS